MKLIIEDDEGKTTVYPLRGREVTVGRREGNTIRLMERNVSRRHARLFDLGGRLVIEDLDSYNGIQLNGERVLGRAELQAGDLVEIGDYHIALQPDDDEEDTFDVPVAEPAPTPALRPPGSEDATWPTPAIDPTTEEIAPEDPTPTHGADVPAEPDDRTRLDLVRREPRLIVVSTELSGCDFALRGDDVIGRVDDCDIVLEHPSVSRRHARVVGVDGGFEIRDLDSANGVLVNDELERARMLASHDRIELGHVLLEYVPAGEPFRPTADDRESIEAAGVRLVSEADAPEDAASGAVTVTDAPADAVAGAPRRAVAGSAGETTARLRRPAAAGAQPPSLRRGSSSGRTRAAVAMVLVAAGLAGAGAAWRSWSESRADDAWDRVLQAEFEAGRFEDVIRIHGEHDGEFVDPAAAGRLADAAEERYLQDILRRANAAIEASDDAQAIELLRACLERDPDSPACHWSIGVAYARNQQTHLAARHYRRFVELAPDDERVPAVLDVLRTYGGTEEVTAP